jgi:hypothetical protein
LSPFHPDATRAVRIDAAVRARVVEGLAAIRGALADELPEASLSIGKLILALEAAPVTPAVAALYSNLVLALQAKDQPLLLSTLRDTARLDLPDSSSLEVVTIADEDLGQGMGARYVALADDDPDVPLHMLPLSPSACAAAGPILAEALAMTPIPSSAGQLYCRAPAGIADGRLTARSATRCSASLQALRRSAIVIAPRLCALEVFLCGDR